MRRHSGHIDADHIIALLDNQIDSNTIPPEMHPPNAIATHEMENLAELASMMG
jgi:hypothetical protein